MTDAELDTLANEILREILTENIGWVRSAVQELSQTDSGELYPTFEGTSTEGHGSFVCKLFLLATVKTLIGSCEDIFDSFDLEVSDRESGLTKVKKISEGHDPKSRSESIRMMAECATYHVVTTFRSRLGDLLDETVADSKLMAECLLGAVVGQTLADAIPGKMTGDARAEIDKAVKRVSDKKQGMLVYYLSHLPFILAKSKVGRPSGSKKPERKKKQDKAEFESKIEKTVRALFHTLGRKPFKYEVAEALGIGGLSSTGSDSRINSFNNKLTRLGIDYPAMIKRLNLHE